MKHLARSLFDAAPEVESPTSGAAPARVVRTLADFDAWRAAQPRPDHTVTGFEHALYLRWCSEVLLRGERIADLELPPVHIVVPPPAVPMVVELEQESPSTPTSSTMLPPPGGRDGGEEALVGGVELQQEFAVDRPLVAYTDGSGTVATKACGAGVVVYDGDNVLMEASRHLGLGTSNHAELSAIRVALAITDAPGLRERELVIRSDSEYAIGCVTRAEGPAPTAKNAKLIGIVRRAMVGRRVRVEWVKGHAGNPGNERADELAGLARLRAPRSSMEAGG